VIFDPKKRFTIAPRRLQSNCDWSPFNGWTLTGYPAITFSRGRLVARHGRFTGEKGWGRFVKRLPWGGVEGTVKR